MIRSYKGSDIDELLACWLAASRLAHPFLNEKFLEQETDNIRNIYLPIADTWVCEQAGKVVGFFALIENEVGAIFLDPIYHGQGLGRALMDKAVELKGTLELDVFAKNTVGQKFYASYGFTEIARGFHDDSGQKTIRLKFKA